METCLQCRFRVNSLSIKIMGLDVSYQAIPADSELLVKKATESERTTTLLNVPGFKKISDENLKYYANDAEFIKFAAIIRIMISLISSKKNLKNSKISIFGRRFMMRRF